MYGGSDLDTWPGHGAFCLMSTLREAIMRNLAIRHLCKRVIMASMKSENTVDRNHHLGGSITF